MESYRKIIRRSGREALGFTLPEVLIVIVIMGIVFSITSYAWFGAVDSRRVDSATNQVAADLRLAHTSASNQLRDWRVVLTSGTSTYQVGPVGSLTTRSLPEGCEVATATTITFNPSGSAVVSPGIGSVRIESANDASNFRTVEFNPATSRVRVAV